MEPVVLDHGSYNIRAGYANPDNDPHIVLSSEVLDVGIPIHESELFRKFSMKSLTEASRFKTLKPITRGQIYDWDVMEDVWHHIFYDHLGWEIGNEGSVMVAEALNTSKSSRELLAQYMFEKFNCSGFFSIEQALLSLFAMGRLNGCTIDIGYSKTEIVPIIDGAIQYSASRALPLGTADLDSLLRHRLSHSHPHLHIDERTAGVVREACCFLPQQLAGAAAEGGSPSYEHSLPDGRVIRVGPGEREGGVCGALFDPSLLAPALADNGVAVQTVLSVAGVAQEHQRAVLDSAVLVGGGALIKGLDSRFLQEAASISPPSLRPVLVKPAEYMPDSSVQNAAWMGGAILAKVVFAQNQQVTRTDYDEWGPAVVHRK